MEKYTTKEIAVRLGMTIAGGLGLVISTIIVTAFVSSPPSRAEFDTLKVQTIEVNKGVEKRLKNLEDGQKTIIEIITR